MKKPIGAPSRLSPTISGVAGEYFVAAELSRHGFIATLTMKNTRGIDLLIAEKPGGRSVGIQVKTNQGVDKSWVLSKVAEALQDAGTFYVFVNLNNGGEPHYHLVKSAEVASFVIKYHKDFLTHRKKDGSATKDTAMRTFKDIDCKYRITNGDWTRLWER